MAGVVAPDEDFEMGILRSGVEKMSCSSVTDAAAAASAAAMAAAGSSSMAARSMVASGQNRWTRSVCAARPDLALTVQLTRASQALFERPEPFQDTRLKETNDVAVGGSHKREKKNSTKPHRLPWRSGRLEHRPPTKGVALGVVLKLGRPGGLLNEGPSGPQEAPERGRKERSKARASKVRR